MSKLKTYLKHPFSFLMLLLLVTAAIITVASIIFIIIYILEKGIPNLTGDLFSLHFNSKNQSMLPSIINTVSITFLTLLFAVPIGIFSAIYLVEYAKKGSKLVKVIRITTETLAGIPSI
ncbi:MAG: phosphate ABC transporter, permease protein PstA, partial [Ruminococcus sp.]